jgi:hypothetical protein
MRVATLAAAAVLIILPGPLFAQDAPSPGVPTIVDPTFLPLQGELFGDSTFTYGGASSTVTNTSGAKTLSRSRDDTLGEDLAYGLTQDIEVQASDAYQWSQSVSGAAQDNSASGFNDPTFQITWRALAQRNHLPFDLDLTVSYAPNAIEGAFARGGDALELREAIGWQSRAFSAIGYVAEWHYGASSVSYPQGVSVDQSSYWRPSIGIITHTRLIGRLSLNIDADYEAASSSNVLSAGVNRLTDIGPLGTVQPYLNYVLIRNRLVASLGYSHTFYGTTTVSFPLNASANYTLDRSSDTLIMILRYRLR